MRFDLLMAICIIYTIIEVPVTAGFSLDLSTAHLVFNTIVDLFFMIDVVSAQSSCNCAESFTPTDRQFPHSLPGPNF